MSRNYHYLRLLAAPLSLPRSMARWLRRSRTTYCYSAAILFWVVRRAYRLHIRTVRTWQLLSGSANDLQRQLIRFLIGAFRHRGLNLLAVEPIRLCPQDLLLLVALATKLQTNQPDHGIGQRDEQNYQ